MFTAIIAYLILCCLFVSAGVYLVRGGSEQIFNFYFKNKTPVPSAIPAAHIVAAGLTLLYLVPFLNLVIHLTGYKLAALALIHGVGWFVTIMTGWEEYYSIGSSTGARRESSKWIDFVLNHTFGTIIYDVPRAQAAPGKSVAWWIGRDGTGMFLRMLESFQLFLAIGVFFHLSWTVALPAFVTAAVFAFVTVLFYGAYNWLPIFKYGNASLNYSEAGTGIWFAGTVFAFIARMAGLI